MTKLITCPNCGKRLRKLSPGSSKLYEKNEFMTYVPRGQSMAPIRTWRLHECDYSKVGEELIGRDDGPLEPLGLLASRSLPNSESLVKLSKALSEVTVAIEGVLKDLKP